MMETMKSFGRQIEEGKYGMAVFNELGMLVHMVVKNANISEVVEAEDWFNFKNMKDDQYLILMMRTKGQIWEQFIDENGQSNWSLAGF